MENLQFLCESGVLSELVVWSYEYTGSGYLLRTGAKDPDSENIVVVNLRFEEGVTDDEVGKLLKMEEND